MRRHRRVAIVAAIFVTIAALGAAAFFGLRYFDVHALRGLVVQRLEAITGREVAIEGDFDLACADACRPGPGDYARQADRC